MRLTQIFSEKLDVSLLGLEASMCINSPPVARFSSEYSQLRRLSLCAQLFGLHLQLCMALYLSKSF